MFRHSGMDYCHPGCHYGFRRIVNRSSSYTTEGWGYTSHCYPAHKPPDIHENLLNIGWHCLPAKPHNTYAWRHMSSRWDIDPALLERYSLCHRRSW